jgi:Fe-S cluster assembly iron-binding protein IscA
VTLRSSRRKLLQPVQSRICLDNRSLPYLDGSTVDWADAVQGLQIANPNVVSSCGCGSSFHVAEDTQDAAS